LRGLAASDLEVYEDGVAQAIDSLEFIDLGAAGPAPAAAAAPTFVAVAFDRLSPGARSFAEQALRGYLERALPAASWMGVFSIDHGLRTLQPFTSDRETLRGSLE